MNETGQADPPSIVNLDQLISMLEGTRELLTVLATHAKQPLTEIQEESLGDLEVFLARLRQLKTELTEAMSAAEKVLETDSLLEEQTSGDQK